MERERADTGATSGLTALGSSQPLPAIPSTPSGEMSLSRSPSPRLGGGWASPGLTSPYETVGGHTSPRKTYGDLHTNGGFSGGSSVTWASAEARSKEIKGYQSVSSRNAGFFTRHARQISSSLSKFNINRKEGYSDKEKLGRGRWSTRGGKASNFKTFIGTILRRFRLRILLVLALILGVVLFYTTRESTFPRLTIINTLTPASAMRNIYRRSSYLGGGSKYVIVLAANQGGGVMEWKGPREWAIERDSVKNKKKYAAKWGYDLEIVDMSTKKRYAHEWRESWEKVDTMRNCMRKYPKAEW